MSNLPIEDLKVAWALGKTCDWISCPRTRLTLETSLAAGSISGRQPLALPPVLEAVRGRTRPCYVGAGCRGAGAGRRGPSAPGAASAPRRDAGSARSRTICPSPGSSGSCQCTRLDRASLGGAGRSCSCPVRTSPARAPRGQLAHPGGTSGAESAHPAQGPGNVDSEPSDAHARRPV